MVVVLPSFITLFFIFLVLKLTHHIDWAWWQVCLPLLVVIFDVYRRDVGRW